MQTSFPEEEILKQLFLEAQTIRAILNTNYEYFSLPFKNLVVKQTIRNSNND